jgi:serine/threonine protein kinase
MAASPATAPSVAQSVLTGGADAKGPARSIVLMLLSALDDYLRLDEKPLSAPDSIAVRRAARRFDDVTRLELASMGLSTLPLSVFYVCRHLTKLSVNDNPLVSLHPAIGRLGALQELDVSDTPLETLPVELSQLRALTTLRVHRCPLSLYPQIRKIATLDEASIGMSSVDTSNLVAQVLANMPQAARNDRARVMLVGDHGSGRRTLGAALFAGGRLTRFCADGTVVKSSKVRRPSQSSRRSADGAPELSAAAAASSSSSNTPQLERRATMCDAANDQDDAEKSSSADANDVAAAAAAESGMLLYDWKTPDNDISLSVWDFGPHGDSFGSMAHQFTLTRDGIYIVAFDAAKVPDSLATVSYWLQLLKSISTVERSCTVIVVGTREDRLASSAATLETVKRAFPSSSFPGMRALLTVDCFSRSSVAKVREALGVQLERLPILRQPISMRVRAIADVWQRRRRDRLSTATAATTSVSLTRLPIVRAREFFNMLASHGIEDDTRRMRVLRFFADVGITLFIHRREQRASKQAVLGSSVSGMARTPRAWQRSDEQESPSSGALAKSTAATSRSEVDSDFVVIDVVCFLSTMRTVLQRIAPVARAALFHHSIFDGWHDVDATFRRSVVPLLHQFGLALPMPDNSSLVPLLLSHERPTRSPHIDAILRGLPMPGADGKRSPLHPATRYSRVFQFYQLPFGFFSRLHMWLLQLPGVAAVPGCNWRGGLLLRYNDVDDMALVTCDERARRVALDVSCVTRHSELLSHLVNSIEQLLEAYFPHALAGLQRLVACSHCLQATARSAVLVSPYYFAFEQLIDAVQAGENVVHCCNVPSRHVRVDAMAPDVAFADLPLIEPERIETDRVLGQGGFGVVYRGTLSMGDGKEPLVVAVKELLRGVDDAIDAAAAIESFQEFRREAVVHSRLRHKQLVRLFGIAIAPRLRMVLEFLDAGDLITLLRSGAELPMRVRLQLSIDIAAAMSYLHSLNPPIVHCDLRTPNVFLCRERGGELRAKVADFGLARGVMVTTSALLGTWQSLAPEVIRADEFNERADVYSFATICYELLTRRVAFVDEEAFLDENGRLDVLSIKDAIVNDHFRPTVPPTDDTMNEQELRARGRYIGVMRRCWPALAADRLPFVDALRELCTIAADEFVDEPLCDANFESLVDVDESANASTIIPAAGAASSSAAAPTAVPSISVPTRSDASLIEVIGATRLEPKRACEAHSLCYVACVEQLWVGCADGCLLVYDARVNGAFKRELRIEESLGAALGSRKKRSKKRVKKKSSRIKASADGLSAPGTICALCVAEQARLVWLASNTSKLVAVDVDSASVHAVVKHDQRDSQFRVLAFDARTSSLWAASPPNSSIAIVSSERSPSASSSSGKSSRRRATGSGASGNDARRLLDTCTIPPPYQPTTLCFAGRRRVWVGTNLGAIAVFDADNEHALLFNFSASQTAVRQLCPVVDARAAADEGTTIWSCAKNDETIRVWHLDTYRSVRTLYGQTSSTASLLSHAHNRVWSIGQNGTLLAFDVATHLPLDELPPSHHEQSRDNPSTPLVLMPARNELAVIANNHIHFLSLQ